MLTIRHDQMKAFEQAARAAFEREMIAHCKLFSPRVCETINDEQLSSAVHSAIERAQLYGFTNRGPIRLFVEMVCLLGSAFDTDPQYLTLSAPLRGTGNEMLRADELHMRQTAYHEVVSGPKGLHERNSLTNLRLLAQIPIDSSMENFDEFMLRLLWMTYPEKAECIGEGSILALISNGRAKSESFNLYEVREQALITTLMFTFGHGCTNDPLYPWINRTLEDVRVSSAALRAGRLEKKALTWLNQVIDEYEGDVNLAEE